MNKCITNRRTPTHTASLVFVCRYAPFYTKTSEAVCAGGRGVRHPIKGDAFDMSQAMEWFLKIVRVAGVNFPGAASLVQLQAELDSNAMISRLQKLEDPISYLHQDVAEVAKSIYEEMKSTDSVNLDFNDEFYTKYSRPLAALESAGLISKNSVLGSRIPVGINLIDPSFIMYMCNLAEDQHKMQEIVDIVDRCEVGIWLNGDELKESVGLPKYVIRAVFEIYESKGYGIVSKTISSCKYLCNA